MHLPFATIVRSGLFLWAAVQTLRRHNFFSGTTELLLGYDRISSRVRQNFFSRTTKLLLGYDAIAMRRYDAIAMILLALVFAAAIPIGGALWSPRVWPFWWGAMLFLRWSISALQTWICVMHGNIRTRDHVVTQKKIELGSRHPSSTVLPSSGTAHSAETDESSASDMIFTP